MAWRTSLTPVAMLPSTSSSAAASVLRPCSVALGSPVLYYHLACMLSALRSAPRRIHRRWSPLPPPNCHRAAIPAVGCGAAPWVGLPPPELCLKRLPPLPAVAEKATSPIGATTPRDEAQGHRSVGRLATRDSIYPGNRSVSANQTLKKMVRGVDAVDTVSQLSGSQGRIQYRDPNVKNLSRLIPECADRSMKRPYTASDARASHSVSPGTRETDDAPSFP